MDRFCLPGGAALRAGIFPSAKVLVHLLLLLACLSARGQQDVVVKNFRISPGYHKPPFERQMKSLLEGASAQPEPGGRYRVMGAKLRTFTREGVVEMEVTTPEALYDQKAQEITSGRTLRVNTADGRFSLEGQGFLWRQTNSSLVISNNVRTVVGAGLLAGERGSTNTTPTQISSDRFQYDPDTGQGLYSENVDVKGTNLFLAGESLSIVVPMSERVVRLISMERGVVLDYEGVHASGGKAVYDVPTGILNVTGNPTWKTEQREGSAEEITIDASNRVFYAIGNAMLKLSGPQVESGGWLGSALGNTNQPGGAGGEVEITADRYEVHTNYAVFTNQVLVVERSPGRSPGQLTSSGLFLTFQGTNELQRLVAYDSVKMVQGDRQFVGETMVYEGTGRTIELTGKPEWKAGTRSGKGARLLANLQTQAMLVQGDAYLAMPAQEFAAPPGLTNLSGSAKQVVLSNAVAEITCAEYLISPDSASFTNQVRIRHPSMRWNCDSLQILFDPGGATARRIVAVPADFEVSTPEGRSITGKGQQAVFSSTITTVATNSILELTGAPAVLTTTNGMALQSRLLVLDLARSRFIVPAGSYKISGPATTTDTNAFRFPKNVSFERFRK